MAVCMTRFLSFLLQIPCQSSNLKSILICYIYHQNEKGKPTEKDLPFLKNDISRNFWGMINALYTSQVRGK